MSPHTHFRTCNLCEAMCGLEIQYQEEEILSIRGDEKDPFSRGHICPKAIGLKDIYLDKNRLKSPVRKTKNGWEEISWEEAIEYTVHRLKEIQKTHGRDAIGIYQGNPNVHNLGSMLFGANFVRALKTKNRFSATSADQLPHHFASMFMFGHGFRLPIPDVDRTDFMLIFGANPLVSNGSIMTAPDIAKRLKNIQKRNGKIVVVDPRRTETAKKADKHIFIQPGQDALLLLALVHTVFEENLVDLKHLQEHTDGLETLALTVAPYTPESLAPILKISVSKIRQLAIDFATASSAVCYGRMGVSTQAYGGLCNWLINALNIITGNCDRPGGAMFTTPAIPVISAQAKAGESIRYNRWQSKVSGLAEVLGELPVSCMAEEITDPEKGQIKTMITVAGNPVLSTPNGKQLETAFEQLDFMLSIDIYINETTRHADIILPPTTGLECAHYDIIFHALAIRNTAKYSPPLFQKKETQRHDWEIFQSLTAALLGQEIKTYSPEQMLADSLQNSKAYDLDFKKLQAEKHGVDLGPLKSCFPEGILTANKKIQLAPAIILADLDRLKKEMAIPKTAQYPLLLIGRRELRSNNSWMHNSYRLVKGPQRCTALIHPQDAQALQIENGQMVKISSNVGTIKITIDISEDLMPGVISIPHGWGHDRTGIQLDIAQAHAGVSINDLTDSKLIDQLTGNAAFSAVPVRIEQIQ